LCEAVHSAPSRAEVKNGGAALPLSHISHGIVLEQLSTGTTIWELPTFKQTWQWQLKYHCLAPAVAKQRMVPSLWLASSRSTVGSSQSQYCCTLYLA
jgi:hypothetical protein